MVQVDHPLRQARLITLVSLAIGLWTSVVMPTIGLFREPRPLWVVLGALGIAAFAAGHAGALYAEVTPWLGERTRRRLLGGFALVSMLSLVLVGPVAAGRWATWAWIGASLVGMVPLLLPRWAAAPATLAVVAVSAGVAWFTGGSVSYFVIVTGGIGVSVAAVTWLQVWFWDVLFRVRQGREAQARLAVTEERLRFARDVHDVLGHNLSVIALKAELAARLAPVDAQRAGQEAAEVQRLAASALAEMRAVVHGYRVVNLRDQITAVTEVLRASGIRCEVSAVDVPEPVASLLGPVLKEASTNVLRHSRAQWCRIEVVPTAEGFHMTVANDGAHSAAPDEYSFGLRGLSARLTGEGGVLRTYRSGSVFTLEAEVPS